MPSPKTPTKSASRTSSASRTTASKGGTATKARTTTKSAIGGGSGLKNFPAIPKGGAAVTVNQVLLNQAIAWNGRVNFELNQMANFIQQGNRDEAAIHGKQAYQHMQQLATLMQKVGVYARQQS